MTISAISAPVRRFVPPPAPKTPKSAATRVRLLDLAAQLFVARGYGAVAIRDIASEAGLTTGALYGHFRSKGQLLIEVIRWKIAERDRDIDFAEFGDDLARGAALIHDPDGRDIRLLEVDAAAAARHDPEIAEGLQSFYADRHRRISEALSGIADPDAAAFVISALTAGVGMRESIGQPVPDADRLTDAILAAFKGLVSQ